MMIRTLKIDGFKSISSEEISLGRVNCFIGANGAGKSNILEALGVLGAAANGVVDDESLLRRGVRLACLASTRARLPPNLQELVCLQIYAPSNFHFG